MLISEIIKVALSSLHANKLRSALTMLGIIVGIFSIIAISTIIEMLQTSIEKGVSQLGQNTFQIQKWPVVQDGNRSKYRNRPDITFEEYERLKEKLVEAKYIGAEQWQFGRQLKVGNRETNPNVPVTGCTPEAFPNNKWNVDEGRAFNDRDVQRYEPFIVLGPDVAKKLFPNMSAVDQVITVDNKKLKVIGVLESQGDFFGQSQDNFAIMPLTTFQTIYGKRSRSVNITVMSHDTESYNDLIETAEGYFRTIRKVPPTEESNKIPFCSFN